jgi:hypothetical protein
MSMQITEVSEKINTSWEPQAILPEPALASIIASDDFQQRLSAMLVEFQTLEPVYIEAYGKNYVSMAERNQLLEKHFDLGTFWLRYDFINREAKDPVCVCTLFVLTDEGYFPWFNRMGQATSSDTGSDGALADAETSARRRILIALGMGSEGDLEVQKSQQSGATSAIQNQLDKSGESVLKFLKRYAGDAASLKLPKLKTYFQDSVKDTNFKWADVCESDIESLLQYAKSQFKGMVN